MRFQQFLQPIDIGVLVGLHRKIHVRGIQLTAIDPLLVLRPIALLLGDRLLVERLCRASPLPIAALRSAPVSLRIYQRLLSPLCAHVGLLQVAVRALRLRPGKVTLSHGDQRETGNCRNDDSGDGPLPAATHAGRQPAGAALGVGHGSRDPPGVERMRIDPVPYPEPAVFRPRYPRQAQHTDERVGLVVDHGLSTQDLRVERQQAREIYFAPEHPFPDEQQVVIALAGAAREEKRVALCGLLRPVATLLASAIAWQSLWVR